MSRCHYQHQQHVNTSLSTPTIGQHITIKTKNMSTHHHQHQRHVNTSLSTPIISNMSQSRPKKHVKMSLSTPTTCQHITINTNNRQHVIIKTKKHVKMSLSRPKSMSICHYHHQQHVNTPLSAPLIGKCVTVNTINRSTHNINTTNRSICHYQHN